MSPVAEPVPKTSVVAPARPWRAIAHAATASLVAAAVAGIGPWLVSPYTWYGIAGILGAALLWALLTALIAGAVAFAFLRRRVAWLVGPLGLIPAWLLGLALQFADERPLVLTIIVLGAAGAALAAWRGVARVLGAASLAVVAVLVAGSIIAAVSETARQQQLVATGIAVHPVLTEVPGYTRAEATALGGGEVQVRYVSNANPQGFTVTTEHAVEASVGDQACAPPLVVDGVLEDSESCVPRDGGWARWNSGGHELVVQRGDTLVRATATNAIPESTLVDAIGGLRDASGAERDEIVAELPVVWE